MSINVDLWSAKFPSEWFPLHSLFPGPAVYVGWASTQATVAALDPLVCKTWTIYPQSRILTRRVYFRLKYIRLHKENCPNAMHGQLRLLSPGKVSSRHRTAIPNFVSPSETIAAIIDHQTWQGDYLWHQNASSVQCIDLYLYSRSYRSYSYENNKCSTISETVQAIPAKFDLKIVLLKVYIMLSQPDDLALHSSSHAQLRLKLDKMLNWYYDSTVFKL